MATTRLERHHVNTMAIHKYGIFKVTVLGGRPAFPVGTVGMPPRAEAGSRPGGSSEDAQWHPGEPKPYSTEDMIALAAKQAQHQVTYGDDLMGQPLPPELCKQARQEELNQLLPHQGRVGFKSCCRSSAADRQEADVRPLG